MTTHPDPAIARGYIPELSSLRGIASVFVVLDHVSNVISRNPPPSAGEAIHTHGLTDFFYGMLNGSAAVEIFFVLSGLVLSLSLQHTVKDRWHWVIPFYIRRVFRIYPALWTSLILVLLLLKVERAGCVSDICTPWAQGAFQKTYSMKQIVLSFMGLYVHLNAPMWSLRTELFYSLLFPLIFVSLRYKKIQKLSYLCILALAILPIPRFYSVHYALAFALGSVIPLVQVKHLPWKHPPFKALAFLAVFTLIFSRLIFRNYANFEEKSCEIIEMLASFVLIYVIFHKKTDLAFLRHRIFSYVGEISYSIYVLHFPVLFALFFVVERTAGAQAIQGDPHLYTLVLCMVTLAVTLCLSALNYSLIEMPFQSLGRSVAKYKRIKP